MRENSSVNGSAQNTSTPSCSTSSARRTMLVSTGGCEPGRTTSDGCGTNVSSTLGTPRSGRQLDGLADDLGVAAVHAVEHPDRHDAMAPSGGYRVESSPALHVEGA